MISHDVENTIKHQNVIIICTLNYTEKRIYKDKDKYIKYDRMYVILCYLKMYLRWNEMKYTYITVILSKMLLMQQWEICMWILNENFKFLICFVIIWENGCHILVVT